MKWLTFEVILLAQITIRKSILGVKIAQIDTFTTKKHPRQNLKRECFLLFID
jgi:hypothetical protein